MAAPNSNEYNDLVTGLVTKSNYRGNVQAIPVSIDTATNGVHFISEKLPQEARVISANLFVGDFGTAFTVDVGDTETANSIGAQASGDNAGQILFPVAGSTAGSVDVGGKQLKVTIGGADNTEQIHGHILIATNE